MRIFVAYGLPGAGKTFIGNVLQNQFGYFHHEGDDDLTRAMKHAIGHKLPIHDDMRDAFFQNITSSISRLSKEHPQIVLTQTFIKQKYRDEFAQTFPSAKFIYIHAPWTIRKSRLLARIHYPLDITYAKKMDDFFDAPEKSHIRLDNSQNGYHHITHQLQMLLKH